MSEPAEAIYKHIVSRFPDLSNLRVDTVSDDGQPIHIVKVFWSGEVDTQIMNDHVKAITDEMRIAPTIILVRDRS